MKGKNMCSQARISRVSLNQAKSKSYGEVILCVARVFYEQNEDIWSERMEANRAWLSRKNTKITSNLTFHNLKSF